VAAGEHPVRLVLEDDLERSRLTVFFRVVLAIPHFIWIGLWGFAVALATIVNWFATLARGRSPEALHRFAAAYVKYATQFYAYLYLAAERYPSFDGSDGYAVDLRIAPRARQSRWSVALRAILLLPAALLFGALAGDPSSRSQYFGAAFSIGIGLLEVCALVAWFAILARGRSSRGLRDAAAYALLYGAQFWAYALLLTDRYPNSDPMIALPQVPAREDAIHLQIDEGWGGGEEDSLFRGGLRRSRLTVFFRLPLAVPHLVWLGLWAMLALLGAVLNWLVTTLAGRSPRWLHGFLSAYVRYEFHVYAFVYLIANPFPGFVGRAGSYPFEIVIAERARQNRWKSSFRALLAIPALLLASAYGGVAFVVAVLGWFSSLARGRMPLGLRNAGALALRYQAQMHGYVLLLTDAYPYAGPSRRAG
jgi:hypothetical protein